MSEDIHELLDADPFKPFTVVTAAEGEYGVFSPRQVVFPLHGETLRYISRDGDTVIIAIRHIIRVVHRTGRT